MASPKSAGFIAATTLFAFTVSTLAACSPDAGRASDPDPEVVVPSSAATEQSTVDATVAEPPNEALEAVVARFIDRANAGDTDGVEAVFTPDARFGSAGRVYADRQEIMQRFLIPEVLQAGGRYQALRSERDGERLVVHYRYDTGSGGEERFTYSYLIRDGLIRDVIGRYE